LIQSDKSEKAEKRHNLHVWKKVQIADC